MSELARVGKDSASANADSERQSGGLAGGTVSRGLENGQAQAKRATEIAGVEPAGSARARRRRRGGWAVAGLVVLAAGGTAAWGAGAFTPATSSGQAQGAAAPATAAVTRQDIAAVAQLEATLGYAGSYKVRGQGGGTLTWLPEAGQVISQGQALYRIDNGFPVVLLYGTVPDWRTLREGVTGQDVTQLNHDLVALGDADSAQIAALGWDYFSSETKAGTEKLQSALGVSAPSGALSLGQVAFEPEAFRVTSVVGSLGAPASGVVLAGTSHRHVVTARVNAAEQSEVKAGDGVTVTLPDGNTAPGVVSAVGTVATTSSGEEPVTTIPVQVTLSHPQAAGTLDQAPVTVGVSTATAHDVLVVPVTALLAQASGGYDVELVSPGNARRYVPVRIGIFDGTDGLVQVTGPLTPGQRVVVPAT